MEAWIARSPTGTRFRLEVDGHPGILEYHGWELREVDIPDATYDRLCESDDPVEIETIHQELWRAPTP